MVIARETEYLGKYMKYEEYEKRRLKVRWLSHTSVEARLEFKVCTLVLDTIYKHARTDVHVIPSTVFSAERLFVEELVDRIGDVYEG